MQSDSRLSKERPALLPDRPDPGDHHWHLPAGRLCLSRQIPGADGYEPVGLRLLFCG